jgi:hypothetical protein
MDSRVRYWTSLAEYDLKLLKELTKRYCTGLVGRASRLTAWIGKRL